MIVFSLPIVKFNKVLFGKFGLELVTDANTGTGAEVLLVPSNIIWFSTMLKVSVPVSGSITGI